VAVEAAREIQDWNQYGEGQGSYEADVSYIAAIISKHLPAQQPEVECVVKETKEFAEKCYVEQSRQQTEIDLLKGEVKRLSGELNYANSACSILNQNVIRTTAERDTARVDTIGVCVEAVEQVRCSSLWNANGYNEALSGLIAALEQLKEAAVKNSKTS
jgi:hypothetical protein